jgi:HK97 family phage portal protein
MGLLNLARSLPRGTRPPERAISDDRALTAWGGPLVDSPLPAATVPWYPGATTDDMGLAMGLPAAWRAMNLIAGFIAQMRMHLMLNPDTQYEAVADSPQILRRPWPLLSYFDWMFAATVSIVLRGNFVGVKADYDVASGRPRQIIPVHPDDVLCEVVDGMPWYHISPVARWFQHDEIFHVRNFLVPGSFWGVGSIEAHRTSMMAAHTLMQYGQNSYTSGAVPPMVIQVDKPEITATEAEAIQTRWMERHHSGNRKPAVIPKIMTITPMGMSMADAEYLQSRQFNVAEIAYMFNLSPEDLGVSAGNSRALTYNNLEQKTRERLVYSLQPIMTRIEQAFADCLPFSQEARFDTSDVLRTDTKTQYETYDIGVRGGWLSINEVRHMNKQGPIPGGDAYAAPGSVEPPAVKATTDNDTEEVEEDDE